MTRRLGVCSPILSLKFSLLGLHSNSHSPVISFLGSLSRFLSPRSFLSSSLFQVLYLIFTLSGSLSQTLWFCILGSLPRVLSLLSRVLLLGISFTKGFSLLGSICYLRPCHYETTLHSFFTLSFPNVSAMYLAVKRQTAEN